MARLQAAEHLAGVLRRQFVKGRSARGGQLAQKVCTAGYKTGVWISVIVCMVFPLILRSPPVRFSTIRTKTHVYSTSTVYVRA